MKKLNKKGITLVELIVSFALIAVAVTYFYQTLLTVNKLYKTSTTETNNFVEKTYALRLLDACYKDINGSTPCSDSLKDGDGNLDISSVNTFLSNHGISIDNVNSSCTSEDGNYYYCVLKKNNNPWTVYYPN